MRVCLGFACYSIYGDCEELPVPAKRWRRLFFPFSRVLVSLSGTVVLAADGGGWQMLCSGVTCRGEGARTHIHGTYAGQTAASGGGPDVGGVYRAVCPHHLQLPRRR